MTMGWKRYGDSFRRAKHFIRNRISRNYISARDCIMIESINRVLIWCKLRKHGHFPSSQLIFTNFMVGGYFLSKAPSGNLNGWQVELTGMALEFAAVMVETPKL